jgi:electron transfer flavoprotein-quinone oxidoreductase
MEKVDCIIVGGGLAGLSAAYGLAGAGYEVMVLERGDYAGAKNVTGGRLYLNPLRSIYPELWAEAPLERAVVRELVTMIGDGAETTVDVAARSFSGEQPQSYTVIRAVLDRWLAERAIGKGAMVLANMRADELLCEGGTAGKPRRVTGIRCGDDEIAADLVIVAEGVLGLLASKAGLRAAPAPDTYALGYKEVIEMPPQVIEDRWHLGAGEGAAQLFVGAVTRGMMGGGFLYTNKESISLGLVIGMEQLRSADGDLASWRLLDDFKQLPGVRHLVSGGTVLEYSAHAIAEGGIAGIPQLFGDGYLLVGDAAGLSLNALVTLRGMDFAIASGYHAAQAGVEAMKSGDTSAAGLAGYEKRLRKSFVLRDLETSKAVPKVMQNPRLFTHYPDAVCRTLTDLFTVGTEPASKLSSRVLTAFRRDFLKVATVKDLWSLRKV